MRMWMWRLSSGIPQVSSMTFLSEEHLAAVGRDDKNFVHIWDIVKGELLFKGTGGISHVFLIRAFYGWRDSGGVEGTCNAETGFPLMSRHDLHSCSETIPIPVATRFLLSHDSCDCDMPDIFRSDVMSAPTVSSLDWHLSCTATICFWIQNARGLASHSFLLVSGNSCAAWSVLDVGKTKLVTTGAKHVAWWTMTPPKDHVPGDDEEDKDKDEWASTFERVDDNPLCMAFAMSADGTTTETFIGHQVSQAGDVFRSTGIHSTTCTH